MKAKPIFFATLCLVAWVGTYPTSKAAILDEKPDKTDLEVTQMWLKIMIESNAGAYAYGHVISYRITFEGAEMIIEQRMRKKNNCFKILYAVDMRKMNLGANVTLSKDEKERQLRIIFDQSLIRLINDHPDRDQELIFDNLPKLSLGERIFEHLAEAKKLLSGFQIAKNE
ncbi:hypothetical protein AAG747_23845 [Rapidithrix thailandica]|uniref:DUF4468 domain-containing protein n=1 Tax=Rapidithrix thailandica TaxID=413964 RepID=A0AAW9S706_9BACT